MVRFLAEGYDTKSNVKLVGFRYLLQASYVSNHSEELWYNETVCLWMTIYIYIYIYILPMKVDIPLNKETKPNQTKLYKYIYVEVFVV